MYCIGGKILIGSSSVLVIASTRAKLNSLFFLSSGKKTLAIFLDWRVFYPLHHLVVGDACQTRLQLQNEQGCSQIMIIGSMSVCVSTVSDLRTYPFIAFIYLD